MNSLSFRQFAWILLAIIYPVGGLISLLFFGLGTALLCLAAMCVIGAIVTMIGLFASNFFMDHDKDVIPLMICFIVGAFVFIYPVLVNASQQAAQQKQTLDDFINSHTFILKGTVTSAKIYDVQSCSFLIGQCGSTVNENISISVPLNITLSRQYTCNYFQLGQVVSISKSPSFSVSMLVPSNDSLYFYQQGYFSGYSYSVMGVPSGC